MDSYTIRKRNATRAKLQREYEDTHGKGAKMPKKKSGPKKKVCNGFAKKKTSTATSSATIPTAVNTRRSSTRAITPRVDTGVRATVDAIITAPPARRSTRRTTSATHPTHTIPPVPTQNIPTRATTRSNRNIAQSRPVRNKTPRALFSQQIFAPSRPTTCAPDQYIKTLSELHNVNNIYKKRSQLLSGMLHSSWAKSHIKIMEMEKANKRLLASQVEVVDRPIMHPSQAVVPQIEGKDLQDYVRQCLSGTPLSHDQVTKVLSSLGVDRRGMPSDDFRKEKLLKGMKLLFDYHFGMKSQKACADILGKLLFNGDLFGKEAAKLVGMKVARSVTSAVFSSVQLLSKIDRSKGSLNDSAIHKIYQIEKEGGQTEGKQGTFMMHGRHKITQVRNIANSYTKEVLGVKHDPNHSAGDFCTFNPSRLLRIVIGALGLKDKAMSTDRPIQLAFAGDGAQVTTSTNADQCTVGLRPLDVDAKHWETGHNLFSKIVVDEETGESKLEYMNYQSTDVCMPCAVVEAKESTAVKEGCFNDFFAFIKQLEESGLAADGEEPSFGVFDILCCGDMSFLQKMVGAGGACKVMKLFCLYCASHGDHDLFYECFGADRCWICVENESTTCTHEEICSQERLQQAGVELVQLYLEDYKLKCGNADATVRDMLPVGAVKCFSGYDEQGNIVESDVCLREEVSDDGVLVREHLYDYVRHLVHSEHSPATTNHTDAIRISHDDFDRARDTLNIEYEYGSNELLDSEFHGFVLNNLKRRVQRCDIPREYPARVELLRKLLDRGEKVRRLRNVWIQFESALRTRKFRPEQSPLCVLHAYMRMVEKMLQQLLLLGMRRHSHSGASLDAFVNEIQDLMCNEIFQRKTQSTSTAWRFPLSNDGKLEDVNLINPKARKVAKGLHLLAEVCTRNEPDEFKQTWRDACDKFMVVTEWIDSKREFTDIEVCQFQHDADAFCSSYFAVTGRDGMTNYFHALRAGHFAFFLRKYKNLYRLSQQGWENVNSRLKSSYHHNTQKGGGVGGSSKLLPVLYTMGRELLWRFGFLDGLFEHLGYDGKVDIDYGKVKRMPVQEDATPQAINAYAQMLLNCTAVTEPPAETEAELTMTPNALFGEEGLA